LAQQERWSKETQALIAFDGPGPTSRLLAAIIVGELSGFGEEILLKAWLRLHGSGRQFVALDDPTRLEWVASQLGLDDPLALVALPAEACERFRSAFLIIPAALSVPAQQGLADPRNSPAVVATSKHVCAPARTGTAFGDNHEPKSEDGST
jgi:4-hydroxy-L-threonine phosphate dehydrogenase PdxA